MKLDNCTTIVDEAKFIKAHKATIERNKGNKYFETYSDRLKKYYEIKQRSDRVNKEI